MSQQTVNNGDTGLSARTKINSNFTELYSTTVKFLYKTNTTQSFTASLNEKILGKVLIPANTIAAGDIVKFQSRNSKSGTSGNFSTRLKASTTDPGAIGADYSSGTLIGILSSSNTNLIWSFIRSIDFKTVSSQEVFPTGVTGTASEEGILNATAVSTLSIDFSVDQWIVVTGQQTSGAGTDTMRLNHWFLELIR